MAICTALFCIAAAGCAMGTPMPAPTISPTQPPPVQTPSPAFPTLQPTPTWTPLPVPIPPTTADLNLGALLYSSDFSQVDDWDLGEDPSGATSIAGGKLTLAVRRAGAFRLAKSPGPISADFFLQVTLYPELCSPGDMFGVAFRIGTNDQHYRYGLTCEGGARAFRFSGGELVTLGSLQESNAVIPGPDVTNRLGLAMQGERMRLFVNDIQVLSTHDAVLAQGGMGLFARAAGGQQLTISFDDLEIWRLSPQPTPSPGAN